MRHELCRVITQPFGCREIRDELLNESLLMPVPSDACVCVCVYTPNLTDPSVFLFFSSALYCAVLR